MDLIMGRFADACLHELTVAELDEYERLVEAPDPALYSWVSGEAAAPADYDGAVLRRLRDFHRDGRK
jgi:antitoxin CptB